MTQNFDPIIWPQAGKDLTERQAIFVYEVARLQAAAMNAPVVPEPWDQRDEAFQNQFLNIIDCYCMMDELPTPEEAHNSWWDAYLELGWTFGEVRDPVAKTHPDMIPFDELTYEERIKDAVFLDLVAMARDYIHD